ncbi:MAG: post-transcriptional regulator [Mycoplasmatota bacterium]
MPVQFSSVTELYNRISPALTTKVSDLRRLNLNYIKEEDIWNYLKENVWSKYNNLALYQMVNDILNVDETLLDNYVLEKLNIVDTSANMTGGNFYEKTESNN